jgi:hypothetical protein
VVAVLLLPQLVCLLLFCGAGFGEIVDNVLCQLAVSRQPRLGAAGTYSLK